jgi:subtilisin-like proprotein convertase family protein
MKHTRDWRRRRLIGLVVAPIIALTVASPGHGASTAPTAAGGMWCNDAQITVPERGTADPYPSEVAVVGAGTSVTEVSVVLKDVSHTFTQDVQVMLVSPTGQSLVLMSDAVGGQDMSHVDLTFSDGAEGSLPDGQDVTTGTYLPTDRDEALVDWPPPAPTESGATTLATFNGSNPNGTWNLYVKDDAGGDAGSIGGWCLDIAVDEHGPVARPTVTPPANAAGWHRGDVTVAWNWSDEGAGVDHARCTDRSITNRAGTPTLTATCQDQGGNPSRASRTVRIDSTAPTVRIAAPTARQYLQGAVVRADYACGDGLSGVVRCAGTVADGARINTSALGRHRFTVTAVDRAGNRRITAVSYTVVRPPTCAGEQVTILGTGSADVLTGTARRDVILAGGGRDTINGRGGADTICAGASDDLLAGLGGNDHLDGGPGADICRGGPGTDRAHACELIFDIP